MKTMWKITLQGGVGDFDRGEQYEYDSRVGSWRYSNNKMRKEGCDI